MNDTLASNHVHERLVVIEQRRPIVKYILLHGSFTSALLSGLPNSLVVRTVLRKRSVKRGRPQFMLFNTRRDERDNSSHAH